MPTTYIMCPYQAQLLGWFGFKFSIQLKKLNCLVLLFFAFVLYGWLMEANQIVSGPGFEGKIRRRQEATVS